MLGCLATETPALLSSAGLWRMRLSVELHPQLTPKQTDFIRSKAQHGLLTGPPGTAKTYTACAKGLLGLQRKLYERIIIVRSAVATRPLGYLPGDINDKQEVYAEPYVDIFDDLCGGNQNWSTLSRHKLVEFKTTSHLRGVTWDNSYVILDEIQNFNYHECRTAATRVGEGTSLVVCGDTDQSDLTDRREAEGHMKFLKIFSAMENVSYINFVADDIVRSGFVQDYVEAEENYSKLQTCKTPSVSTPQRAAAGRYQWPATHAGGGPEHLFKHEDR